MAQAWHSLLLAACVLLVTQVVHAQETNNGQGKILWAIGKWLSGSDSAAPLAGMGWTDGGNPCNGWGGVSCNSEGYVTSINLAGKGLTGSIPSDPGLWAGLTGLTNIDLANNQLSGSVPAAIKSAPLLNNANLADNRGLCGYLPTGLAANTGATGIGIECGAAAASPSPSPSPPPPPPPPSPAAASPAVPSNTSTAGVSPAPAASPATAAPQVPAAPLTEISSAPICSCALRGFGSQDCTGALAKECRVADPPAVCANRTAVLNDTEAATALGQYLADACFKGQNMDTSICTCVQNLLGNDCAKARVSLCVKGDPLCLPLQNVLGDSASAAAGNTSADAAQQVATALNAQCAVAEPNQAGVKATMEFPDLSMGQYISKQYTQNVANALSSVTDVPTSSISTLDVRPFTGAARPAPPKRLLLQAAGNGVQATYFLGTEDPTGVSQRLSTAANDGTLSSRLAQYGITAQAGGLRVQNYLQPAAPTSEGGSSFPLWALAPIIIGSLLLIGACVLCFCCLRKKRRGKKAEAYAPAAAAGKQQAPVKKMPSGRSNNDLGPAPDMPGKGYDGPRTGYVAAGAGAVGVGAAAAAAAGAGYKPASSVNYKTATPTASLKSPPSPNAYDTAPGGNGKIAKGPAVGAGVAAGAAAAAAAAAAGGAAAMKRSGSNRAPRPESPASGKGSGGNLAPLGVAGAAAGTAPTPAGLAHLSNLQSMKVRDYEEPIARAGSGSNSTLTPWEAASRSGSSGLQSKAPAGPPASASGVTGGPLRTGPGPAAGVAAAGAAVGAGAAAGAMSGSRSGSLGPTTSSEGLQGSGSGAWKSNVRPATGQMPNAGGPTGSTMMANPAAKSSQQAERAKFWAQFQETWQQVRQTQNVDNEPGSPSSGTNWTDITDARTARH